MIEFSDLIKGNGSSAFGVSAFGVSVGEGDAGLSKSENIPSAELESLTLYLFLVS